MLESTQTNRDERVVALAQRISKIMQESPDRFEALDAHTVAGIFYRSIPSPARKQAESAEKSPRAGWSSTHSPYPHWRTEVSEEDLRAFLEQTKNVQDIFSPTYPQNSIPQPLSVDQSSEPSGPSTA